MTLTQPRILILKAGLFVVLGFLAGGMILMEHPEMRTLLLLAICVWAFSRAYYFAFYVIGHYIDPGYRFAGISAAIRYLISRGRARQDGGDRMW